MLSEEELDIEQLIPKLKIDAELTFDQLNARFFSALQDMAPLARATCVRFLFLMT